MWYVVVWNIYHTEGCKTKTMNVTQDPRPKTLQTIPLILFQISNKHTGIGIESRDQLIPGIWDPTDNHRDVYRIYRTVSHRNLLHTGDTYCTVLYCTSACYSSLLVLIAGITTLLLHAAPLWQMRDTLDKQIEQNVHRINATPLNSTQLNSTQLISTWLQRK